MLQLAIKSNSAMVHSPEKTHGVTSLVGKIRGKSDIILALRSYNLLSNYMNPSNEYIHPSERREALRKVTQLIKEKLGSNDASEIMHHGKEIISILDMPLR